MESAWQIGRLAGVAVRMHVTFPLLLAWVALEAYLRTSDWAAVALALAPVLGLFGLVVLHELGHALVARRFGIRTIDIILLPIGGVARLHRKPLRPLEELAIALAGPLVNLGLAAIVRAALPVFGRSETPAVTLVDVDPLAWFYWANVGLALFNLLPALPLDGGRVLRALLSLRLDPVRATRAVAGIGRGFAVVLAALGLTGQPILLLLGIFIWLGADAELDAAVVRRALPGVRVGEAMLTEFECLEPEDDLRRAVERTLAGSQADFPVVREGTMVGLLERRGMLEALARAGPGIPVAAAMRRDFPRVDAADLVEDVIERRAPQASAVLPVFAGPRLIGLLTPENLTDFLLIHRSLAAAPPTRPARTPAATEAGGEQPHQPAVGRS